MTATQLTPISCAPVREALHGDPAVHGSAFRRLLFATTALIAVPAAAHGPVALAVFAIAVAGPADEAFADGGRGGANGINTAAGGLGGVRSGSTAAAGSAGVGGTPSSGSGGGGGSAGSTGAAGGAGGNSTVAGDGGNGGAGGNAGVVVTTSSTLVGATGQNGANGGNGSVVNGGGGGGGEGGIGTVVTDAGVASDVQAGVVIRGGNAGTGGDGNSDGGGGQGGDGGIGLLSTGSGFTLATLSGSTIAGGAGGQGGDSNRVAGAGGDGGAGIVLLGGGTLALGGSVAGGGGGDGENTILQTDGVGGDGGVGILAGSGGTITLAGNASVVGGNRGEGGSNDVADGSAGAGIVGQNLAINIGGTATIDSGTGDGGAALRFTEGTNSLSIASATSGARILDVIDNAGGTLTLQQASDVVFNTVIGGSGNVVKAGPGYLTLTARATYTGTTTISGGTLEIGANDVLGPATRITVDGGTLALGANMQSVPGVTLVSGAITGAGGFLASGTDFDVRSGTVTGRLGGAVGLTKTTAGIVTLSGSNGYTGTTTVSGGTLALGASGVISNVSNVVVSGGELAIGANDETVAGVALRGGAISGTTGTLTSTTGYAVEAGSISARLGGSGGLTKSGAGTVILGGANSYSGNTTVQGGTLALAASNVIADGSAVVVDGGTFDIGANSDTVNDLDLFSGTVAGTTGLLTSRSRVELRSGIVDANLDIQNGELLVKIGTGTVILSGTNVYTGSTQVDEGTLELQGGSAILDTGLVDVANGTTLRVATAERIGALVGAAGGTVDLAATLTTGDGLDAVFAGNAGGAGGLVKEGAGTVTLAGANTYSGATTINGGTLALSGSIASAVTNSANMTIAGSGSAGGGLANNAGANIVNAGVVAGGLVNAGTYAQTGGSTNGGVSNTGTIIAIGGAFNGGVTNAGSFAVGGGTTVTSDAAFANGASGTLQVAGGGASYALAGVLTNNGAIAVGGGGTLAAGGSLLNQGGGIVTNAGTISGAIEAASGTVNSTGTLSGPVSARGASALNLAGRVSGNVALADSASLTVTGDLSHGGTVGLGGNATMSVAGGNSVGITRLDNASAAAVGVNVASGRRLTVGELTSTSGTGTTRVEAGGNLDVGSNIVAGSSVYTGLLTGAGTLNKEGTGTTVFASAAAVQSFTGVANVNSGTLSVDGVFGDTAAASTIVNVGNGATLGGGGTIAGTVNVRDGGALAPGSSPGTLTVANLSLSSGSSINYELGSADNPTSALNDRTVVTGNLTLDGTLNVVGAATTGYYRIFDVNTGGAATSFTDNGLAVGVVPTGATGRISVIAPVIGGASPTRGEVNLQLLNGNQQMQFWDGGTGGLGDGVVAGGSGVWNATNVNWANTPSAVFNDAWQSDVAVFRGAVGTVTVDGTQSFEGLQFSTDGYVLQGGTLAMTGDAAGGTADRSFVTVDAGVGATITSGLTGVGLTKRGSGTLVLSGGTANSYMGQTVVSGGTVQLVKNSALGATGFDNRTVLAAGTTLDYVAGVSIAETVELAGAATLLQDDGAASLAVQSGAVVGSGQFTKAGNGILELSGTEASTYAGATVLSGGTLRLGKSSALGATGAGNGTIAADGTTLDYVAGVSIAEAVTANGTLTLLQDDGAASTATQSGQIDGAGGLFKQGDGTLVLAGANTYSGATTIANGRLALAGAGGIASSSIVNIGSAAAFDISGTASMTGVAVATLAGAGQVSLGGQRLVIGAGSTGYGGVISGSGGVDLTGGRQVLSGQNTYSGGTRLTGGTLGLGSSGALGAVNGTFAANGLASGALVVTGGTVEYTDTVAIANEVVANGAVTFAQAGGSSLQQGRVSGNGSIVKTGAGRLDFSALNGTFSVLSTVEGTFVATNSGTLGGSGIAIDARGGATEVTNAAGGSVSGTLSSSVGASLSLTNAVGGTVSLGSGSTSTLSGTDRIENGGTMQFATATTLGGVESFINSGTLSTTGGSLTYSGGGTDFVNAGAINLQNNALGDSVVIDGSFTANAGSSLFVDVDFSGNNDGGALLSDQLLVSGEGRGGVTTVNFNNIAANGVQGLQFNPIVVASFGSVASGADLVAANLPSDGIIRYRFGRDGAGNFTIGSTLNSDAVGGLAANFSSSQALISASLSRPTNSFVSAPVQPEPDQFGYAPWFRAIGGKVGSSTLSDVTNPNDVSETQQADIDIDYAGGQFGFDIGRFNMGGEGSNVNVGVTGGFNSGTALQDGFANETTFDTSFVGLYAAYTNGSFFGDAQVRWDYTDFEILAPSVSDTTLEADTQRLSFNASAGYTFEIAEGTSLVPSVGLTYALLDTSAIGTEFGDLIFDDTKSLIGFASTTLARTFVLPGEMQALTPFVTGTIYSDFGDDTVSTFSDVNGLDAQIVTENIGTYGEIGVGMNYRRLLDENRFGVREMIGAVRADFTIGDTTEGAGVTGQFRLQF